MDYKVQLLPHQLEALQAKEKWILLISGVGGGKTFTGAHWAIQKSMTHKKSLGLITANTYSQLRDSTLATLFKELDRFKIDYHYNQSTGHLEFMGKTWLCKSLENYDTIRGIEIGEWLCDESAYAKYHAFLVVAGRLRDKHGSLQSLHCTTPKGFNWVFHNWSESGEHKLQNARMIKAIPKANIFLPEGYYADLESQYDTKLAAQEISGDFITVTSGNIYWAFNAEINVAPVSWNGEPLWAGFDFNISPMTAAIGFVKRNKLYIFDEISDGPNSSTDKICRMIKMRYPNKRIVAVPDSTGKKATTNSHTTDHKIMKEHGFEVKSASNPFRVDRYAVVNSVFEKELILIDPKCSNIIRDLEQVVYKEGTDKPDTSDKSLGHITDALGYLIYRTVNPYRADAGNVEMIARF